VLTICCTANSTAKLIRVTWTARM